MKLRELKAELERQPAATVRFALPNGETVPAHAHVTEVARVDKRFVDCGGTLRSDSQCRLQTWISDDLDHRLTAGKLLKILVLAAPILGPDDLEVDVEHEVGFISQFPLASITAGNGEVVLKLSTRHTACLAPEKCKPRPPILAQFNPSKFNFEQRPAATGCCTPPTKFNE
jgi:Family of unknown function (DUF6428)